MLCRLLAMQPCADEKQEQEQTGSALAAPEIRQQTITLACEHCYFLLHMWVQLGEQNNMVRRRSPGLMPCRHQELGGAVLDMALAQSILASALRPTASESPGSDFKLLATHAADSRAIISVPKR